MKASYGKNKLLVTYPPLLKQLYPDHVTNITLYGRLISLEAIINVQPSLYFDKEVRVMLAAASMNSEQRSRFVCDVS